MSSYATVVIDGREIEVEWEGDEGGGNGRDEPRVEPSIAIIKATEDGARVTLTEEQDEEAQRQIWADIHRNSYLDHLRSD